MALRKFLILRRPPSGRLEGRTALIQLIVDFLTASCAEATEEPRRIRCQMSEPHHRYFSPEYAVNTCAGRRLGDRARFPTEKCWISYSDRVFDGYSRLTSTLSQRARSGVLQKSKKRTNGIARKNEDFRESSRPSLPRQSQRFCCFGDS
jgi:hypothetical protein